MLGYGPLGHLCRSARTEDGCREALCGHREEDPTPDLEGVVRTGDIVEQKAPWNGVSITGALAQAAQDHVRVEIAHLQHKNPISDWECNRQSSMLLKFASQVDTLKENNCYGSIRVTII